MKRIKQLALVLSATLITVCAFAQPKKDYSGGKNFAYTFKVKGVNQGDTTLILIRRGDQIFYKDTVIAQQGGIAVYKGDSIAGGVYLFMTPNKKWFEFLVAGENNFTLETDTTDFTKNMKVSGSYQNKVFYDDMKFLNKNHEEISSLNNWFKARGKAAPQDSVKMMRSKQTALNKKLQEGREQIRLKEKDSFWAKVLTAMQDPDIPDDIDSASHFRWFRAHYFDNIDFCDKRMLHTPILANKVNYFIEKLTLQHPDTIITAVDEVLQKAKCDKDIFQHFLANLFNKYAKSKIMCFDKIYVHIFDRYYATGDAWWMDAKNMKDIKERVDKIRPLACGNAAPPLIMKDRSGRYQSLYNVQEDYTVLVFWNADCSHCKKEMPKLVKIYQEELVDTFSIKVFTAETEVDVKGDSTNRVQWEKFLEEKGMDKVGWINVADFVPENNFRSIYDIFSTPVVYILDKEKKIIAKRIGVEQIKEIIERHIKYSNIEEK